MEQDLLTIPPDFKLYDNRSIYVGTILGGPLVAGYFAAENFKQIGERDKIRSSWLIAIGATMAIIAVGLFFTPALRNLPHFLIPLLYTSGAQYLIQHFQGTAIKTHLVDGGKMYSTGRGIWIGLVGLLITAAIVFVVLFLTNKELLQALFS